MYECSCCTCCVCYDRLISEHVLVITSCTARARHKYSLSSIHLPKKIGLGRSADFLHSGTGYIENSRVRSMIDFFADFSRNFSERALLLLKNVIKISITKIGILEPVTLKKACLFHVDEKITISITISNTISITNFCIVEHGLPISITISITIFCTVKHPF